MVTVINQNRFRRVFGTAPDGPFAQVGRHWCGSYRVEQRAAVSSGVVCHPAEVSNLQVRTAIDLTRRTT